MGSRRSGQFATDTGTTPTTSMTYTSPGTYTVGLRVTNDEGMTSTVSHTIVVENGTYASDVLATGGLTSFWQLNEPAGSTILADGTGANPATNSGATPRRGRADLRKHCDGGLIRWPEQLRKRSGRPVRNQSGHRRVLAQLERLQQRRCAGDGVHPELQ